MGMLLAAIAASAVVASCNGGNPVPTTNAVQPSSAAQATTTTVTPTATVTPTTTVTAPVVIAAAVRPVGIVSYECETLWPGHRSAHSLTFDGSQVTQVFGVEQHGVLTLAGTERLPELLAAIDPTAIAAHFEGEAPPLEGPLGLLLPEGFSDTACELRLDLGETIGVYTWDDWPADDLSDLHSFLGEAIMPIARCKATDAIEVIRPCNFLVVD